MEFWRSVPGYDIVLGMNRDESSMPPADPPTVLDGTPIIVPPRDRQAGGTWPGGRGSGLVGALPNRRGRTSPSARSRGHPALDALRQPGGAASSSIMTLSNAEPGENGVLCAHASPCWTPYRGDDEVSRRLPSPD